MWSHFVIAAAALVTSLPGVALAVAPRLPPEHEVEDWITSRASTSEALRAKVAEVRESYEIVFVPGILGSQLKIGDFTYGKDPIEAHKLVFEPRQPVEPATLNEFTAHLIGRIFKKDVDIYGKGLNAAQSANRGRPLLEFPYDWRDDLDKLADDLEAFLNKQIPGKKFVIVAHSMGGVIAWHWKNTRNRDHKRDLLALVTLGSPLRGSCEPIRMLLEGYGPPEKKSSFEKWATHIVFREAHAAIFTFPSVFGLLPKFDKRRPCLKIRRGSVEEALDHHEIGTWFGRSGGDYELNAAFADKAKLDLATYKERVAAAVTAGRDFRGAFDWDPLDDRVYLLYSGSPKISSHSVVVPKGADWLARLPSLPDTPADGRVSAESAMNAGHFDARAGRGMTHNLNAEHGDLLADDGFSDFIRENIGRLLTQLKQTEILAFAAAKDPSLKKELEQRGWLGDTSLATTSLARIGAISDAVRALATYNYELLAKSKADPKFSTIDFARADPASALVAAGDILHAGDEQTAAALYATAIVFDPNKVDAIRFDRLGTIRLKEGRALEAASYFTRALKAADQPGVTIRKDVRGHIHNGLGLALERAGSPQQAIASYKEAIEHGMVEANSRIEALRLETTDKWAWSPPPTDQSARESPRVQDVRQQ